MNDLIDRVDVIMKEYLASGKNDKATVQRLFDLHNEATGLNEVAIGCGGCRKRVYNKLREWWVDNKINPV